MSKQKKPAPKPVLLNDSERDAHRKALADALKAAAKDRIAKVRLRKGEKK